MAQFKIFFTSFDSDVIVAFKLVHCGEKVGVVHTRNLHLATHQIDSVKDFRVGNDFFFAKFLENFRNGFEKHEVLTRLATECPSNLRPVLNLIYVQDCLVSYSNLGDIDSTFILVLDALL